MTETTCKLSFSWQPKYPLTVYCLVEGGSIPLAISDLQIILLDRNILSTIDTIEHKKKHNNLVSNEWWISFLNSPQHTISPILSAFEGTNRQFSSYTQFCTELDKNIVIIKRHFPKVKPLVFNQNIYSKTYELLKKMATNYSNEIIFLKEVAPLIAQRTSKKRLFEVEKQIRKKSKELKLPPMNLPLIACLSCLYESSKSKFASIGRLIIKPKVKYDIHSAHNALMDIYSIIFLVQAIAIMPERVGLCTSDKALMRFWNTLNPTYKKTSSTNNFSYQITLTNELFEELNKQELDLLKSRLENDGITE